MSLSVPNYKPPQFATALTSAYAWIGGLVVDFALGQGRVHVLVNPDAASGNINAPALDSFTVGLGDVLVPGNGQVPDVSFPTLMQLEMLAAQLQAQNPGLTPFAALRAAIYQALVSHPKLAGATQVP